MSSFSIIVYFYILKNCSSCFISTGIDFSLRALLLQCCPKTLNHGIIITITSFTHTRLNILLPQQLLIARARIFTRLRLNDAPGQLLVAAAEVPYEEPLSPILHHVSHSWTIQRFSSNTHLTRPQERASLLVCQYR
jgi:hypothetical protein